MTTNPEGFPTPGSVVPTDQRNEDHVRFIASWCKHDAWAPAKDVSNLEERHTVCSDCALAHFPETYSKILDEVAYKYEGPGMLKRINEIFGEKE